MRLLICATEFPPGPGGIGTQAFQVASHLVDLGWEVSVACVQDYASDAEIEEFNRSQRFRIERLPSPSSAIFKAAARSYALRNAIRDAKPDVILATGDRAILLAGTIASLYRHDWAAIEHGRVPGWRIERVAKKIVLNRANSVVCVSAYTRERTVEEGVQGARCVVVSNGADESRFKPLSLGEISACRRDLRLDGTKLIITVGNVTRRKGQEVVIRSLPHILERENAVHYLIVGLPTEKDRLLHLAERLKVQDHVHFLGRTSADELVRLVGSSDLFVMTSQHNGGQFEGYGIAVVEAALCGKPAVVSNNSGLAETVVDGVTGLVVPEGDPKATADAVLRLMSDEELLCKMGDAARERALRQQTWRTTVNQYDRLLRAITSDRRRPDERSQPYPSGVSS